MIDNQRDGRNTIIGLDERIMGTGDFMWLWLSMTAQMGIFLFGSSLTGRISYVNAVIAIAVSNVIVLAVLILNGDVGTKYGLHFSLYLKAPFGIKGRRFPSLIRALTGIFWFGIQTYYGALAIDISIQYLTGYSNWLLWYILFGIIQIIITAGGISWIKFLMNTAAPTLLILSVWLIYVLLRGGAEEFLTKEITDPIPFLAVVTASLSYWVTVAVNISDFTRHMIVDESKPGFFSRNKKGMIGQLPGIMIGMILFVSVGMIGSYFTGHGNPVEIISSSLGGNFMLLGLLIILLAQLSTNISANLYAPGNILSELFEGKLNFKKSVYISGIIGLLTSPWLFLDHFLIFLPLVGAFLAPLPGIMIVDYFILRRAQLSPEEFLKASDKFYYTRGYNIPALTAYVVAGTMGIVFLDYSWFVSFPISSALYYLLMRNKRLVT